RLREAAGDEVVQDGAAHRARPPRGADHGDRAWREERIESASHAAHPLSKTQSAIPPRRTRTNHPSGWPRARLLAMRLPSAGAVCERRRAPIVTRVTTNTTQPEGTAMNFRKTWLATLAVAAVTTAAASAANVVDKENVKLNVGGYLQAIGVAEHVPDQVRDENRLYLFLKQARIRFDGSVEKIPFEIMLATGGEDITPNTNAALGLLDFNFDVPLGEDYDVKIGQFHVPYGRERLTDDSTMNFGDRSIENLGFAWNRDYGVALTTTRDNLTGTFAVMTGGGRDIPQRYLPEKLGSPMLVARFGYNDGIDRDIYHVTGRELAPDRAHKAAYLNVLYIEDSTIGHSTVVNVRATDKNLLVNGNYNPFIGRQPFSRGKIWQG